MNALLPRSDLQSKFTEQIDLACALMKEETLANNVCQNWETDLGRPISKMHFPQLYYKKLIN